MDPEEKPRARMRWPFYAALTMLVPVVYVLSVGPAYWLLVNDYITVGTMKTVYAPLFMIVEAIPDSSFAGWLASYIVWVTD